MTADHAPERLSAEDRDVREALYRLADQAGNTAGDAPGRRAAIQDYGIVAAHLADLEARLTAVEALLRDRDDPDLNRYPRWIEDEIRAALHPDPSARPR